jgi:hypothetical protein
VDAVTAGKLICAFDRLHSVFYFAAPMGAVGAEVVAATFYNFNPELVATAIPAAWDLASPETLTAIRYEIVCETLPRLLGDELSTSAELARRGDPAARGGGD